MFAAARRAMELAGKRNACGNNGYGNKPNTATLFGVPM